MRGSADRLLASTGGFGYADDMMRNALPALRALVITTASLSTGCATIWQVNALEEKIDTLLKQTQRETLRDVFGERGLQKLIERRTDHQAADYLKALSGAASLREKVRRLARLRTEAGYLAAFEATDDGFLLVENHCPVCKAARACTGLCQQELDVFRAALGPDVSISRTDHILAGARRCAYHIRQKKAERR
jgi:predicted ArsR family transcriptional regulator